MNLPEVYWVRDLQPKMLAFGARPRPDDWLDDEIRGYRELGFRHVVSLLEPAEARQLGLLAEGALCAAQGIRFHSLPIPDRGVPAHGTDLGTLVGLLADAIGRGEPVYVHCRAGIGRSSIITALLMHRLGVPFESIFPALCRSRGLRVPDTEEQELWVRATVSGGRPPAA